MPAKYERVSTPVETHKVTINYADLVALGAVLTGNIRLMTLKQKSSILGVRVEHSIQFTGTSTLTVSVGNAASATAYTSAYSLVTAVADTTLQETALYKAGTKAEVVVNAYFTATGTNLNTLGAGSVTIYITVLNNMTEQPAV